MRRNWSTAVVARALHVYTDSDPNNLFCALARAVSVVNKIEVEAAPAVLRVSSISRPGSPTAVRTD